MGAQRGFVGITFVIGKRVLFFSFYQYVCLFTIFLGKHDQQREKWRLFIGKQKIC